MSEFEVDSSLEEETPLLTEASSSGPYSLDDPNADPMDDELLELGLEEAVDQVEEEKENKGNEDGGGGGGGDEPVETAGEGEGGGAAGAEGEEGEGGPEGEAPAVEEEGGETAVVEGEAVSGNSAGTGPGGGGGGGGGPLTATGAPSTGGMSSVSHSPSLDEEQSTAITEQTGITPEQHAAAVQAGFESLKANAEALQVEAVSTAQMLGTEVQSMLASRGTEIAGQVSLARSEATAAYSAARARVTEAAGTARGQVEADATSASAQLDSSYQSQRETIVADYEAGRLRVAGLREGWIAPFDQAATDSAAEFQAIATEMSTALAGQKEAIQGSFTGSGDAIERYKGTVRSEAAGMAVDAGAERFNSEAPAKAAEANAAQDYPATIDGFLAPLADHVTNIGQSGMETLDGAYTSATGQLDVDKESARTAIESNVTDASLQLDEDEAATLVEIDGMAGQLEADVLVRQDSAVAVFTDAAAGYADAYRARLEAMRAGVPEGFVSRELAEEWFAAQEDELLSFHDGNIAHLEGLRDQAVGTFEEDVAEDLGHIQTLVSDNSAEAATLADEKAGAIEEAALTFGQSMILVGGAVDSAMAAWVPPQQQNVEGYIAQCESALGVKLEETIAEFGRLETEYRGTLQGEITNFVANVNVEAAVAGVEAELQGMAENAYSAMRGWGTDENKLFNALRKCTTALKGEALKQMWRLQYPSSGSLWSWLDDDLTSSEMGVAEAYLAGNTAEGARLELETTMQWYGDDEAQIEAILRDLSPEDRIALQNTEGWAETRENLTDNLDGTDLNVTDSLLVGNDARADAYRLRDKIDSARRQGNHDALHEALAGVDPGRLDAVQQEMHHISNGVEADAVDVEPIDQAVAEQEMVDYVTRTVTTHSGGRGGRTIERNITGANADLAEALIREGNDSVTADVARFEVERTRGGGPKEANMETALYASADLQGRLRSDDPAVVAEAEAERDARAEQFREQWAEQYGSGENASVDDAIDSMYEGKDNAAIEQRVHHAMLDSGTNSAEVVADLTFLSIDGAGTDEARLKRSYAGMRPDEVDETRQIYAAEHGGGDMEALDRDLGVNEHSGWGSEVSGDDRREMEALLLGDEQYMTAEQRLELVNHELKWTVGSESSSFGRGIMGSSHEDNNLREHANNLQALLDRVSAREGSCYDDTGAFVGTPAEYQEYTRLCAFIGINATHYREQQDRIASFLTTAAAVIVAAAVTFATGGAAGPAAAMWIAGLTGASKIALNTAILGGRYGWEQTIQDAGITAVEIATAGAGKYFTPEGVGLGRELLVEAGTGFVGESAKGLITEQEDWLSQGLRGGLMNSAGALGTRGFKGLGIEGPDAANLGGRAMVARAGLSGLEESIGEISKGTAGLAYDGATGKFTGDFAEGMGQVFGGVPVSFLTGSLKSLAGDFSKRLDADSAPAQDEQLDEAAAMEQAGINGEDVEQNAQGAFDELGPEIDAAMRAEIERYQEELVMQELIRMEEAGQGQFVDQVLGAEDLAAMQAMMMQGGAQQGQGDATLTDTDIADTDIALSMLERVGVPGQQLDNVDPVALQMLARYSQAYARGDVAEAQRLLDNVQGGASQGLIDMVQAQVIGHHYGGQGVEATGNQDLVRVADILNGNVVATSDELAGFRAWYGDAKLTAKYDEIVAKIGADHPAARNLAPEELVAVFGYTTDDYALLNPALRTLDPTQVGELLPYLAAAQSGLLKMPTFDGTTVRGTGLPPEIAALTVPGNVFTDAAFLSSSRLADRAFKDDFKFIIEGQSGVPVELFSDIPTELEVLFPAGSRFRVTDRYEDGGVTVIEMTEIAR